MASSASMSPSGSQQVAISVSTVPTFAECIALLNVRIAFHPTVTATHLCAWGKTSVGSTTGSLVHAFLSDRPPLPRHVVTVKELILVYPVWQLRRDSVPPSVVIIYDQIYICGDRNIANHQIRLL